MAEENLLNDIMLRIISIVPAAEKSFLCRIKERFADQIAEKGRFLILIPEKILFAPPLIIIVVFAAVIFDRLQAVFIKRIGVIAVEAFDLRLIHHIRGQARLIGDIVEVDFPSRTVGAFDLAHLVVFMVLEG